MSDVDDYIAAAERENTRKSYESALRHFEAEWKGFLPATAESVARYLSDYAASLAINTLKHRLSAISRWHVDNNFPDPTRTQVVRQVMKGIRNLHAAPEKRAKPLVLDLLQQVNDWLERGEAAGVAQGDHHRQLRHTRDRAMLLIGFWRGFRSDELVHLQVEHIEVTPGKGMTCYLPKSKGDRQAEGRTFQCPALSRLCPVTAYERWIAVSGLKSGPVFRGIDRWGKLNAKGMSSKSLIPWLRDLLTAAGIKDPEAFSSHSLRRGFAGWARSSGWDLQDMMTYVGWTDIKSAMRYTDATDTGLQARFEQGLPALASEPAQKTALTLDQILPTSTPMVTLRVSIALTRFSKAVRGLTQAQRLIEQMCLERYAAQRLDKKGQTYELKVPCPNRDALDETVYALLDDMHRIAEDNQCFLEATIHEPATDAYWD